MKSQINSIEDAFKAQGIDPTARPLVSILPDQYWNQVIKDFELDILIRALNSEGLDKTWVPDYSDLSQPKYEHWYMYSSASGWSLNGVVFWTSATNCGSRRVFRTKEIAYDAWNRFSDLFKERL